MKAADVSFVRPRVRSLSKAIAATLRGAPMLAVSGGAILGAALAIAPPARLAAQQPAAPQQSLEEITVTGSRIVRQDFSANSPITTIDEASFQNTSTVGVEKVLNELPQFVPALSQFTTTDVQQTANNTIGARTLSLRGLGANRNLVLIDGKRGMPINPTMVIDTNSIPRSAISRIEVITGGASAVYGADAVGGVVNFILKDDFEGASVDVRFGDTQHGGNQEVTFSGLIGTNAANDRGNVMIGVERSSQTKVLQQERDWRVADMANPATPATAFGWGSDTWISSDGTNSFIGPNALNSLGVSIGLVQADDFPDQNVVNAMFNNGQGGSQNCAISNATDLFGGFPPPSVPNPYSGGLCPQTPAGVFLGVPNTARFLLNRPSGTLYTGLMNNQGSARSDLYQGPFNQDHYGNFAGLPFRVEQPDGQIKENNFWQWASGPLERLSAFGKGHFDVSDNVRVTGTAMYTRTEAETSLGLTADLITFWGAAVPFGLDPYNGNPAAGIPATMIDTNGDFVPDATHPAYLPGGRFGVDCNAPATAAEPWHDGLPGCTQSEVWPVTPQVWQLMRARRNPDQDIWISRPPDYIRNAIGSSRSGTTTNTTAQFELGIEGELGDGNHSWEASLSTGRTDTLAIQAGSARLSTYRGMMSSPNFGRNAIFDPNAFIVGFAESTPTCTSGLPVIRDFAISDDCVTMLTPDLKNQNKITQSVFEFNLVGDLVDMKAGPLGYALGTSYRENAFTYTPDNLSLNQNFIDPIAGLFPNEGSSGEFDVAELYGELLVPIIADGPTGVDHFSLELGARISDWSMEQVKSLNSYKAMIDWGITPKYRLRAGINRAHRAPNLGELFITRTQVFGGDISSRGDVCSQRNTASPWSANTGLDPTAPPAAGSSAAQAAQTLAICRALMGVGGAAEYYRSLQPQPTVGGVGIQNQLGNAALQEEQADTLTVGVVMDFLENWTLAVDYYSIEIEDMIALEGSDSIYQRCVSREFNASGDPNAPACRLIFRDPTNGNPSNIDRAFNNEGRVEVEGVDLQLSWNKMMAGGGFSLQMLANYNLKSATQDREDLPAFDWAGTNGCALQIQCQGYDYRLFTTLGYFRGNWGMQLRHQFWPSIKSGTCVTAPASNGCRFGLPAGFGPPGVDENYQQFAVSANYAFKDRYTLRMGIENLLDEEPPLAGADPTALPFPIPATHIGGGLGGGSGATYDPLGRRYFVSMTMDF